ncbi:hypothetical protein ScPMuIL_008564 [Solemya velum]
MKEFRRPTLAVIRENGDTIVPTALPLVDDCDKINNNKSDNPISIDNIISVNNNSIPDDQSPEEDTECDSDMAQLMETATRLRLKTRRPSIMAWRAKYIEKPKLLTHEDLERGDPIDDRFTEERKDRINQAIEWLRNELQAMRSQDQDLARQLLCIRHDIHKLKLQWSCEEHQEMLDDFQMDMEELHELNEICDMPLEIVNNNPLKHLGVTPLNMSSRRFSMC